MVRHHDLTDAEFRRLYREGAIVLAGNRRLRIFGTLRCTSGQRMLRRNRVFFASEQEAWDAGYRPCGHCLRKPHCRWRLFRGL